MFPSDIWPEFSKKIDDLQTISTRLQTQQSLARPVRTHSLTLSTLPPQVLKMADVLSPIGRNFYEKTREKLVLSIVLGAAAMMLLGFTSNSAGLVRSWDFASQLQWHSYLVGLFDKRRGIMSCFRYLDWCISTLFPPLCLFFSHRQRLMNRIMTRFPMAPTRTLWISRFRWAEDTASFCSLFFLLLLRTLWHQILLTIAMQDSTLSYRSILLSFWILDVDDRLWNH